MKHLPFNACDYRCEHCFVTAECAVYQKLQDPSLQHMVNESDFTAVLHDVRESFRETENLIKLKAWEAGIDIDAIAGTSSLEEVREQQGRILNDPLYQQSHDFTIQTSVFLDAARHAVAGEAIDYIDDIAWHHTMVTAKIYRALGWRMDEYRAIDAKNSAAVAMKSLTMCIMAFDELASRYSVISQECRRLSAVAQQLKRGIQKRMKAGR
jgi:hypothetical protein